MQFKDKRIQWALSVLPTALLVLFMLRMFAGAEFVIPSDASGAEDAPPSEVVSEPAGESETEPKPEAEPEAESTSDEAFPSELVQEMVAPAQGMTVFGTMFTNSREQISLKAGDSAHYSFTPTRTDSYIFRAFPVGNVPMAEASVLLVRTSDEYVVAKSERAEGFCVEAELEQGESYRLEVDIYTDGAMIPEVMVNARGRCFDNPISLPSESIRYAKTIVRARDVHWFRFTAPVSGRYIIRTEKSGDTTLDTLGYLLDERGSVLAMNDDILFPGDTNFLIEQDLTAGETYYIRISALSNLTGAYRLVLTVPEEGAHLSESLTLSQHELVLDAEREHKLSVVISPANAPKEVIYASSDQNVVTVEPDGTLHTVAAGKAVIWAITYNGVRDECHVEVRPVPVSGLSLSKTDISLCAGEQIQLEAIFTPANATNRTVIYQSSDESVLSVSANGLISALKKGDATVTAVSQDGGFSAAVQVHVESVRPTYRALVIGEQSYEGDVRIGGENTARGVADMFRAQSIDGASYQVRLQMDSSRRELIEGISAAFGAALPEDISVLYINAHGAYENGIAYIRMHDGSRVTVRQLEEALRSISGKIVIILDFCQSGSFIGAGGDFERFCLDTQTAFGASALTSGRYTVIASAASDQDSYRRAFTSVGGEEGTAAIMGRSLCEGAGWDLIYDRAVSLKADANRDKQVTVQEIYAYTRRRVIHYLEGTGAEQTVHIYPEGDQTVIFGRN